MTKADISLQTPQTEAAHPVGSPASSHSTAQVISQAESQIASQVSAQMHPPFHPIVAAYFDALNRGDYQTVVQLFAPEGTLLPPFESALVGPEAILQYLSREAKGMIALPQSETHRAATDQTEPGGTSIQVLGQVQTALFSVNVSWQFGLNAEAEIVCLRIKLLATLRDLLHLKP